MPAAPTLLDPLAEPTISKDRIEDEWGPRLSPDPWFGAAPTADSLPESGKPSFAEKVQLARSRCPIPGFLRQSGGSRLHT